MNDDFAFSDADRRLLAYVQQQTNTGTRTIRIPAWMLENTTANGLTEARRLAKLCGCTFQVDA